MKNYFILIAAILILPALNSCNSRGGKEQSRENARAAQTEEKKPDIIELSAIQMKAVGIEIGGIEQKNLKSVVKASGQLEVPPQNRASVSVLLGGVIKSI